MKKILNSLFENKVRRAVALFLAIVVTFGATYMLVLPAITLEQEVAETVPGLDLGQDEVSEDEADARETEEEASDAEDQETEAEAADAETRQDEEESSDEQAQETETVSFDAEVQETVDGETHTMQVHVEADADAFPEGTTMDVAPVTDETVLETIGDAVEGDVATVHAVDITFTDADGKEVQPQEGSAVQVTMASDAVASEEETAVVQYTEQTGETVQELEVQEDAELQVEPENDLDADSAVTFEAETSATFAIVEKTTLEKTVVASDRRTYHISVTYGPEAGVPDGVELAVTEIENDAAYQEYVSKAEDALGGEKVAFARFFDITILKGDQEIQPEETVQVRIEVSDELDQAVRTVHFAGESETAEVLENELDDAVEDAMESAVIFDAEGFSIYGVVTVKSLGDLDGESYGILNNQNTVSGTALDTGTQDSGRKLSGKTLTVRTEPVKRTENVFVVDKVAKDSDITMWSFHAVSGSQNKYYITTEVNGQLKYLCMTKIDSLTLVDQTEVSEATCGMTITAGTGTYSGKYKIATADCALCVDGSNFKAVAANTNNGNVWMNLAELSNLTNDDFVTYTAKKVSVSGTKDDKTDTIDYDVKNGDRVIVYTRIWNENTLRYDYYAIDHDGVLVKAYESGDTISWVGSKVNTMLWGFTEYYYEGTTTPNYYYELQNLYSGKYLAPKVSGDGFLSDSTIGINLNGRRYGEYFSTILAWDDDYYDYASLKVKDWKLVSAPISKADTFYFAVMKDPTEGTYLSTVATVDSEPFGITLKMQNYGDVRSNGRSQEQTDVLQKLDYNQWGGTKNLLTKYIAEGDSYPKSMHTGRSLSELYSKALTVNQQFLLSTYQETGYFEYDSTQNFAHLITSEEDKWFGVDSPNGVPYGIGDFVIYSQIASTTESNGDTRKHGQFFPYNDLVENAFITTMANETDIHGNPLSSLDPNKGEKLYKLQYKSAANDDPQYVDFFFGMEMDASFMQSESGLDAWGHDLIFEFSGDDDFWLYIDDMLVLDLGGIHSSLDGSINFRTGAVKEQKGKNSYEITTLRARFETAYKAQYPKKTQAEVNEWLNGIFKDDGSNTGTVFKDFSGHTMKMFYMERGAGASNLHMRFNLAPYVDGEVQLEKEVSGTDTVSAEFPFQIWYEDSNHVMVQAGRNTDYDPFVVDAKDKKNPIRYEAAYKTADGVPYKNVYFLRSGQTASVQLPSETTKYYFVECGLDTATYDRVTANGKVLTGTAAEGASDRKNFSIAPDTVSGRKKVVYNNHVSGDALKTLTITKKLWQDGAKEHEIHSGEGANTDNKEFRFRIYIGTDGEGKPVVYNTGKYYVKDPEGNYCVYQSGGFQNGEFQNGGFKSTGKKNFSDLSTGSLLDGWKNEQEAATFYTSPGGAADKIKAGYSIEIPDLMAGTAFYVEERDYEIPSGYDLIDYTRLETVPAGETANRGEIGKDDVTVIVNNRHGYGLSVKKVWSDAAFMENHDEIYFAVYRKGDTDDNLTLVEDSVRQLGKTDTSLSWFFPELEPGKTLNDYVVYEVKLSNDAYTVNKDTGDVTFNKDGGCTAERIKEGGTLTVGGQTNEHGYSDAFDYTASYTRGWLTQKQIDEKVNARTDMVSNSRAGIKLVKTDMEGKALPGATFTLIEAGDDKESTKKTFVSDEKGLIAVAYLDPGTDYILTETAAPYTYRTLIQPLTIKTTERKVTEVVGTEPEKTETRVITTVYVDGLATSPEDGSVAIQQVEKPTTATNMPTISIKNKPFTLKAIKMDAATSARLNGAEFELYQEVLDYYKNVPMPDYYPMEGFESLITGETVRDDSSEDSSDATISDDGPEEKLDDGRNDGVIPKINLDDLSAGTYYLREKKPPSNYKGLSYYIRLTITPTGQISMEKATYSTSEGKWEFSAVPTSDATLTVDENSDVIITIMNTPERAVQILKMGINGQKSEPLDGVEFALYQRGQIRDGKPKEGEKPVMTGTTGGDRGAGILYLGTLDANISYYLFETKTLDGYQIPTAPVIISTTASGQITATLNGSPPGFGEPEPEPEVRCSGAGDYPDHGEQLHRLRAALRRRRRHGGLHPPGQRPAAGRGRTAGAEAEGNDLNRLERLKTMNKGAVAK